MRKIIEVLLFIFMAGFLASAFALEGETIVFNPATGNYLITYWNSTDDTFRQVTFIPSTKINPTLDSKFKLEQDSNVHYRYALISERDSQQDIVSFILDPVNSVATSLPDIPLNAPPGKIMDDMDKVANYFNTPSPWEAFMYYSDGQMAFRMGWGTKVANGLQPGSKAAFGFKSRDLPGIIKAQMSSFALNNENVPSGETDADDGGFGQQYHELLTKDYVTRPAAVPTIAVPNPFNAPVLIGRIQTQMHTWVGMKLLDATFSFQLDRDLTAAANAYHFNQLKAGKEHIQTLRKMLKKEHEDADKGDEEEDGKHEGKSDDKNKRILVDRLAARVLDFDLKYVLKRMGDD